MPASGSTECSTDCPIVYVVDDDVSLRQSLRFLLEAENYVVATMATGQQFLDGYDPDRNGCLVLDLRMPGMSGLQLQEYLVSRDMHIPVVMITGHADVPVAVRAMKAGMVDFIEKPFDDRVLLDSVRKAIRLDAELRRRKSQRDQTDRRLQSLSTREQEVMERVVAGKANKVVAAELGLSLKTVEYHRAKVMEKMECDSLAELVRQVLLADQNNQGGVSPGAVDRAP
ncbi:MAG: response regulator transcription factor [Planctomycetia bacterium]